MRLIALPLLVALTCGILLSNAALAKAEPARTKTHTQALQKPSARAAVAGKATVAKPARKAVASKAAAGKVGKNTKTSKVAKTSGAGKASKVTKSGKSSQRAKAGGSRKALTSKAKRAAKQATSHRRARAARLEAEAEMPQMSALDDDPNASEQIYDGLLPTEDEKIVMPAMADERGRAECVQLLKSLMNAPRTLFWKEGRKLKVSWDRVEPGTAIATFKQGRYPQQGKGRGSKHAAIFLRASHAGIWVFDQFAGKAEAAERFIPWHHPRDKRPSNNASAYSTVRW